jgi:RNA polymerase sigma-70 factor, ECF subfamily
LSQIDRKSSSPSRRSVATENARPAEAEADLVARVAAGDAGPPMEELCARYSSPLYALGLRLLGDGGASEEMVQDTFVRLWRSAGRFDRSKGSVRTFIYTIARRAAVDIRRRASSRPLSAAVELEGSGAAIEDPRGAGAFDRIVLGIAVREALASLSAKHRETLDLHFREDLTQRQIASRLDIPLGTVKTRTYHALRALKKELEEREIAA